MQNIPRISKGFMLPLWVIVSVFLMQGSLFGATPPPELGDNLVINGDFEQGRTEFQSQYTYFPNTLGSPGGCKYCVDTDASTHYGQGSGQPWNGNGNDGHGHYDSNSKFLMASGGDISKYVWRQTVNVKQNTDYQFSTWICHLYKLFGDTHIATLKFCINDDELGTIQTPGHRNGYIEFSHSWSSGNDTTAVISIYDINPSDEAGNDFGLDDISLRELLVMGPISRIAPVCASSSMTLTPPEVYCEDYSGQWEILQGDNVLHTFASNTISNVPIGWNGCLLRYAVNCQGVWFYSNAVPLYVTLGLNVDIQIVEGNDTICEGDTVHLHANVTGDVMDFDFIRVGDILCTDGSIVHPSDWASSGKTAKGIVFYVDETDVHGWALGLTQNRVKWSNNTGSISGMPNISVARNAIRDLNGEANTGHINTEQYPAAWYCIENGGYLPSIGQLNVLFGGFAIVNASLELVEGVTFPVTSGWFLWSSTAQANDKAYCIDRSGKIDTSSKTINGTVDVPKIARPVYDF